jgi:hypothetical protein
MMNRNGWSRFYKVVLLSAGMSGATLYAAVTIDPSTQPAMTVAPYTLKESNLYITGGSGTQAYRAWYENGAWMGDLIEYDIAANGDRSTDVVVGYSPPAYPGDGSSDTNWSARSVFAKAEGQSLDVDTSDPQQYDDNVTTTYWQTGRSIFTYSDGSQVPFLWTELSTDQHTALDSATADNETDNYASPILNFIRGDRSNEFPDGVLRRRYSILGDIVNSQPVYVANPVAAFTLSGYSAYKNSQADREGRVYVGANDGMLHAFNADTGSEVFSYIPSMLIGELNKLTARPYSHTYFVDGQLYAGDANNGTSWGTYLTGGLGAGGKGLWALDITDENYASDKIVWEKQTDLGYIHNRPQIALFPDGNWYVATGNGYASGTGNSVLHLLPIDSGASDVTHIAGAGNGLSGVTLVDSDGDFVVNYAYAGDLDGNLYRFKFNMGDSLTITATKLFTTESGRPITVSPDVALHPYGGYMVYFGTGSLLSSADASDTTSQGVYGIWDRTPSESVSTVSDACDGDGGTLLCQTLTEETFSGLNDDNETVSVDIRYTSQSDFNFVDHNGWRVDLPDTGERLIGNPQVRAERVQFTTTSVSSTNVTEINSWLMGLHWLTGSDGSGDDEVIYDLNQDGELDSNDRITVGTGDDAVNYAAVGLKLGEGNLSQPTIARVQGGVDIHYINGIRMPAPEPAAGPIAGGLIDVTTDTPYGGVTTNAFARIVDEDLQELCDSLSDNEADADKTHCYGSPENPIESGTYTSVDPVGSGYGNLPDGHVHAYDKVHGTSYVDYLNLEPRRGEPRLDAYTGWPGDDTDQDFAQIENGNFTADDNVTVVDSYQVHDTLARLDRLGLTSGAQEPYDDNTTTSVIPDDQKFVVVLANADLSTGAVIQIGCETWTVQEYQDAITPALEGLAAGGDVPSEWIHTLSDIRNDSDDGLSNGICAAETLANGIEKSEEATLRIMFYNRVVQDLSIVPTLPQCVWGTFDYNYKFDGSNEGEIDPADNPLGHLTEAQEKNYTGYRWRNGALTMQLLEVNDNDTAAYTLQGVSGTYRYLKNSSVRTESVDYLPHDSNGNRVGGVIAQAFEGGLNEVSTTPVFGPSVTGADSGMLYESSIFFDYGDWFNFKTGEAALYCYGNSNQSRVVQEVVQGMEWGHYTQLTDIFFTDGELNDLYYEYLDLVNAVQSAGDEDARRAALQALSDFFAENPLVQVYDKLRDWRGDKVWQKENTGNEGRILPIDRSDYDSTSSAADDGTPSTVDDISRNLTPVLGPNFILGRRTWIDLMQQ